MPRGRRTRPTSDRVREGLFSSLADDVPGAAFLDLYAGSGAVGLEAASRGARSVVLVEREPAAVASARANIAALELPGVDLRAQAVASFLSKREDNTQFDIVFVDPPYADPVDDVLAHLVDGGWLAARAVVVVERDSKTPPVEWPDGVHADRSRRYGDTTLWYGRRP